MTASRPALSDWRAFCRRERVASPLLVTQRRDPQVVVLDVKRRLRHVRNRAQHAELRHERLGEQDPSIPLHVEILGIGLAPHTLLEFLEVLRPDPVDAILIEHRAAQRLDVLSHALDQHLARQTLLDV